MILLSILSKPVAMHIDTASLRKTGYALYPLVSYHEHARSSRLCTHQSPPSNFIPEFP